MAHIIVMFSLHYDDTYSERYGALYNRVREIAIGEVWDETTSSCVFQSSRSAVAIDVDLCTHAKLDGSKDKLVVIDLDSRTTSTTGLSNSRLLSRNLGF